MSSNKEEVLLQFSAKGLDKMDWFGKSDPFLEFSRSTESNQYILVHRSEVIKNTLDPDCRQLHIKVGTHCDGDCFFRYISFVRSSSSFLSDFQIFS